MRYDSRSTLVSPLANELDNAVNTVKECRVSLYAWWLSPSRVPVHGCDPAPPIIILNSPVAVRGKAGDFRFVH